MTEVSMTCRPLSKAGTFEINCDRNVFYEKC